MSYFLEKHLDIDILLVSGQKNYKCFIGYLYIDYKNKPLHIKVMIVKLNGCIFLTEDDDFLEVYNAMWYKVNANIKKRI